MKVTPLSGGGGGRGVLPYKWLMGMCHWLGLHFHHWIDFNGVTYFNRVTSMGLYIFKFFGARQFFIFTVSKFVLQMTSKVFFIESKKWVNS